jgi:hypothetical protein
MSYAEADGNGEPLTVKDDDFYEECLNEECLNEECLDEEFLNEGVQQLLMQKHGEPLVYGTTSNQGVQESYIRCI